MSPYPSKPSDDFDPATPFKDGDLAKHLAAGSAPAPTAAEALLHRACAYLKPMAAENPDIAALLAEVEKLEPSGPANEPEQDADDASTMPPAPVAS